MLTRAWYTIFLKLYTVGYRCSAWHPRHLISFARGCTSEKDVIERQLYNSNVNCIGLVGITVVRVAAEARLFAGYSNTGLLVHW